VSLVVAFFRRGPPDLQILDSIAFLVFCVALPCDDVRSEGGEAEFEDVGRGERSDDMAERGVDDRNPGSHVNK
jgi:hypothetical protein